MIRKLYVVSLISLFLILVSCSFVPAMAEEDRGKLLAQKVVEKSGGIEKLYSKKDIEYVYIVRDSKGNTDISLEQYIFDGELSRAEYPVHDTILPGKDGTVNQVFNGDQTWTSVNGKVVTDKDAVKQADFLRKTNYYWTTMMFKLTDPGTKHEYQGTRTHEGTDYEIVRMTFEEGVGDVSDKYVLYINPDTMLVDLFLFTVMDFGITQPFLMEMSYKNFEGLLLPVYRRYTKADWEGNIKSGNWTEEITVNPEFNNGFSEDIFVKPHTGQ